MLYEEDFTPEQRLNAVKSSFQQKAASLEKFLGREVSLKPLERLNQFKGLSLEQTEELRDEFFDRALARSDESCSWELASEILSNFLKPSWA